MDTLFAHSGEVQLPLSPGTGKIKCNVSGLVFENDSKKWLEGEASKPNGEGVNTESEDIVAERSLIETYQIAWDHLKVSVKCLNERRQIIKDKNVAAGEATFTIYSNQNNPTITLNYNLGRVTKCNGKLTLIAIKVFLHEEGDEGTQNRNTCVGPLCNTGKYISNAEKAEFQKAKDVLQELESTNVSIIVTRHETYSDTQQPKRQHTHTDAGTFTLLSKRKASEELVVPENAKIAKTEPDALHYLLPQLQLQVQQQLLLQQQHHQQILLQQQQNQQQQHLYQQQFQLLQNQQEQYNQLKQIVQQLFHQQQNMRMQLQQLQNRQLFQMQYHSTLPAGDGDSNGNSDSRNEPEHDFQDIDPAILDTYL